jgi:hypothetical protein
MEIGTIETAAEVTFLKSKYSTILGTGIIRKLTVLVID